MTSANPDNQTPAVSGTGAGDATLASPPGRTHMPPTIATAPPTPIRSTPGPARHRRGSLALGTLGQTVELSTPLHNLLNDEFIMRAPRVEIDGRQFPSLGGIPLLSKLGQGGMGAVYYGIHRGLMREVAVKVLPFHLAENRPDLVKRFFREARIASQIQSDHLVRVTDVDQEATLSYLVMDFVAGKTASGLLRDVLVKGETGMDELAALEICIGACKGLAAAHAANVVHRDVKPDNILVPFAEDGLTCRHGAAKLADLGLARMDNGSHSMTHSDSCLGTPGYMAPEQAVDSRQGAKPADVFGIGATLYALLCGEPPFTGESPMMALWATVDDAHTPVRAFRPSVSKPVTEVIDICLAKDPTHRYVDGGALLKALEAARKALKDPQSINYADVNQPRIEREKQQRERDAAAALEQTSLTHAGNIRNPWKRRVAAAVVLAVIAVGGAYATLTRDAAKSSAKKEALPDIKKLDELARDRDAGLIEEERARKKDMEEFTKKLESLKSAGQSKSIRPGEIKPE